MLQDRKLNATVHTIHQRGALDWRSQSKKKEIPVCRSIPLTQTVNNCFFPPTSVCIGGGGQPFIHGDSSILKKRMEALYKEDANKKYRKSHENPSIIKLYKEFLGEPYGEKAHKLLHTHYSKK